MKHLRALVRIMVKEATMLSGPKRIALLRQTSDPNIQRYIAMVDAAKDKKELQAIDAYEVIPDLRGNKTQIGGLDLYWTVGDLYRTKEAELNRAIKAREREMIDAKKADQQQKKTAVADKIQRGLNNPVLKNALDRIGADFHAQIKTGLMERDASAVERYFVDGRFTLEDPGWRSGYEGELERRSYNNAVERVRPFIDIKEPDIYDRNGKRKITLKTTWPTISERLADMHAAAIVEKWKHKMSLKLGEVIDRKGGATIKVEGTIGHEHMDFTFADGSSFDMKTQQVWSRSKLGKDFCRFPTTFHNVKFIDGTFMKVPSSEKMQAEFGISDATASKD